MSEAGDAASAGRRDLPLAEVYRRVEEHRGAGRLDAAEHLLNRLLQTRPREPQAIHLLGIIAHQRGRLGEAIEQLKRAIILAPQAALYHAQLGELCRLAGRLDEAIAEGERALVLQPDFVDALNSLGIAHHEKGEFATAIERYRRAIALQPQFAEVHSNLGNALHALKRYEEAVPHYRRALELRPGFADPWNNLGTTLRDLKRYAEAEAAYRQALALRDGDPGMLNNLALCLRDLRRPEEAETVLRRSLAIEERNAKTLLHLGTVLLERSRADEAAGFCASGLALSPDDHDLVNLSGRVAFARDDLAAAETCFRRALALQPDLADALNNLGNVLKELGRLDEAHAAYRQSLAHDPDATGVYVNYAESARFAPGDPHLPAMEALRDGHRPLDDTARLQLDFALGKAYADLGDYRRSFARLLSGNALKRAQTDYDEAAAMALFDRIEAVFTAPLLRGRELDDGLAGAPVPIFVIGMPRSGTTLVEQIIASHSQVHGAGELKVLAGVATELRGPDGISVPYPEFVPAIDAAALADIGRRYLADLRRLTPGAPYVTDKMPSNYYFAGLIHLALPQARIIHTIRSPIDTCLSCFSKLFAAEQNHTYDLGELGRYYRRYRQLMAHWRRVLPPGRIVEVRYEDLVADLDNAARRLIANCGLPWDERCLAFHRTERPVRTASATQVRQPIYQTAVGRWQAYEEFLGPLLAALGDWAADRK